MNLNNLHNHLDLNGKYFNGKGTHWITTYLMNSYWKYFIISFLTLGVSFMVVKIGLVIAIVLIAGVIGGPFLVTSLFKTEVGIYLLMTIAVLIGTLLKLTPNLPIGIVMDLTILLIMLGIIYRGITKKDWKCFYTPVSIPILIWAAYNFLQVANPSAVSRLAWVYVARPAIGYIFFFFAVYGYLDSKQKIKNILLFIIFLMVLSGLWGIKQFLWGYADFEMIFVIINDAKHLLYINGRWRSFGTMGSPAQFGVFMAIITMMSLMFLQLKIKWQAKLFLLVTIPITILALVWSGTRSGFAVIPVFIAVMVFLARNYKLYILAGIGGLGLIIIINMPTNNYHIQRIQSTFKSKEDESFKVREQNREMITPYIISHPLGGGMGSTGVWGMRFSPGTFLASFAPDSGFIRVAVEMGWVGLILYLYLWGAILTKAILGYWKMKDKELKIIVLTIIASIIPVFVVEYAQDIVGKLPANLLFWVLIAIIFRSIEIDKSLKIN